MIYAKLSTAITIPFGPVLDSAGAEFTTLVVGEVKISKNNGTPAALNGSATLTHKEVGIYELVLTTSDISAVGQATLTCSKTTYIAPPVHIAVLPAKVYDSLIGGTDNLEVDVTQLGGVVQSLTDLKDFADDGYDPGTNKVQGVVLVDTLTTYTGNTAQTGDTYALANGSAGFVAIDTVVDAILADTGTDGVVVAAGSKSGYSLTATTGLGNQTANITGTITTVTTATNVTTVNGLAAGVITAASIAADAITDAKVAADVTIASVTGAVGSVTGLTAATVHSDLDDIQARLPAALTGAGNLKADVLAIDGSTTAADRLQRSAEGIVFCTVGAASTTTSIVTSAMDPAAAVIDQFKGRIVIFDNDTTTANLRGQATDITASTAGGVLTVTALTTAPVSGDTFTIV